MTDIRNSIKEVIEGQAGNGDWNGISTDEGHYEGNVDTLNIDANSIEVEEVDLEAGTITVTARGDATATHTDADGNDVTGDYDIKITAKVNIDIGSASILGVVNDD